MTINPETLRDAPEIQFNGATFGILMTDNEHGGYDDWEVQPVISERHVPGSNKNVVQSMGMGAATANWRIWCDTIDEFQALRSQLLTVGTLTILANMQSMRGTTRSVQDQSYEDLTGVLMVSLSDTMFHVDGRVESTVTFKRGAL